LLFERNVREKFDQRMANGKQNLLNDNIGTDKRPDPIIVLTAILFQGFL
jgi:hypothetical protein